MILILFTFALLAFISQTLATVNYDVIIELLKTFQKPILIDYFWSVSFVIKYNVINSINLNSHHKLCLVSCQPLLFCPKDTCHRN